MKLWFFCKALLAITLLATASAQPGLQQAIEALEQAEQNRRSLPHYIQSSVWSGDDPEQTEKVQYLPNQAPELLLANGQTPNARELRQFNRRTARESSGPPFRLVIDQTTLVLHQASPSEHTYHFQPIFLEADEETPYGQYFTGTLVFDPYAEQITQVTFRLTESFRYKIFTIESLLIDTQYQRIESLLVPSELVSDVRMKTLLLNVDFSVHSQYLYHLSS